MFDQNPSFVAQNYLAYTLFDKDSNLYQSPCIEALEAKGIHIGFEAESIKAPLNAKNRSSNQDDSAYDEEKSTKTSSTLQSTPKSERHFDRSSVSQEKSLLGKRKKFPLLEGCNDIENYTLLNYIHEGVYGTVYRAQDKFTGTTHAIKKVKLNYENHEGFPVTALREINLLKTLKHPNIINLNEVVMSKSLDQIFLVTEYAEHELRDLIQNHRYQFSMAEIKSLMKQLLEAMAYLHSKNIVHRDLKTSNILYTQKGLLKVCDFGLSRKMAGPNQSYTPMVVTLAYRAPELLLGCKGNYTSAIDMWSVGCIFAELLQGEPLFRAKSEMELIDVIFRTLGTPTTTSWPGWKELEFSHYFEGHNCKVNTLCNVFAGFAFGDEDDIITDNGMDLLEQLLVYDPEKRITAAEALKHPWFAEEPAPKDPKSMPVFPATNEMPRQMGRKLV